jgi:hypothetical protein
LPDHIERISGEIDFFIIIPTKGILCLEVKAHFEVRRDINGNWLLGKDPPDPRGPFKQASQAAHSLRNKLASLVFEAAAVPVWSAVLFPYLDFKEPAVEWHPWQALDRRHFQGELASAFVAVLENARALLAATPDAKWFKPESLNPSPELAERIAEALRPEFEVLATPKQRRKARNDEMKFYSQSQLQALRHIEGLDRAVFCGAAGTGKTLLALESARRASQAGTVLLCCYNTLLGRWLRDQASALPPNVWAGTLHSLMREAAGIEIPADAAGAFWHDELPWAALQTVIEGSGPFGIGQFEFLIVDEAQDILRTAYLEFLDAVVAGGWRAGKWQLFGDFTNQAIFTSEASLTRDEALAGPLACVPPPAMPLLLDNCRNTEDIAEQATILGGLNPPYMRVLRGPGDFPPDIKYFGSEVAQAQLLLRALEDLWLAGYRGDDIVILSTRNESSAAEHIDQQPWKDRLTPLQSATAHRIRFGTIHAFKGLEASAVIVTDVFSLATERDAALLYVAVTRPTHRLTVLAHNNVAAPVLERLVERRVP